VHNKESSAHVLVYLFYRTLKFCHLILEKSIILTNFRNSENPVIETPPIGIGVNDRDLSQDF